MAIMFRAQGITRVDEICLSKIVVLRETKGQTKSSNRLGLSRGLIAYKAILQIGVSKQGYAGGVVAYRDFESSLKNVDES